MRRLIDAHLVRFLEGLDTAHYLPASPAAWQEAITLARIQGLIEAEKEPSPRRYKLTAAGKLFLSQRRSGVTER